MRFINFNIRNFKGIQELTIDLNKSPKSNIYTLVGLNESGKTTILEAISSFRPNMGPIDNPDTVIDHSPSDFIPLSRRDNFNDEIRIAATLELDDRDLNKINDFVDKNTGFKEVEPIRTLTYTNKYKFKNSKFTERENTWTGFHGIRKGAESNKGSVSFFKYMDDNNKLATFFETLIPNILYFPNFLFDFPSKIYLVPGDDDSEDGSFYRDLIQDILYSLRNGTNLKEHLVERIKSDDPEDVPSLRRQLQLMERKISEVVFGSWNAIFHRKMTGMRISISYGIEDNSYNNYNYTRNSRPYLEFNIEANDGVFNLKDRSLGFRWFFTYLMFTKFRTYRTDAPGSLIFLFDEPASNLHSSAQTQLLKSFEEFGDDVRIIYATHSHYLINPHWLESTYIVRNEGFDLESPESNSPKNTNIIVETYKNFVARNPHKTDYFQPVLDVLEYVPSNLEKIPNCVFLEGKNDFYTLEYFDKIVLKSDTKIHLMPGTGAGTLGGLISLYTGWGKNFVVLLDSDQEGKKQKTRYEEKFGKLVEGKIFTFGDINSKWTNVSIENLFDTSERISFQRTCFPDSDGYNKDLFNRAIQESLVVRRDFCWSERTSVMIREILLFLGENIGTNP